MINFNIIWFEDTKTFYESTKKRLERKFKSSDLHLNFKLSKGRTTATVLSRKNIDLILMDHNLFNVKGNTLIDEIRKKKLLTEIIYYSKDAKLKYNVNNVEGLYFSNKENLFSMTSKLIEKSTRTINEVSVQRGCFISEVIDLEAKIVDMILKYFPISTSTKEKEFRRRVIDTEFFSTMQKFSVMKGVINDKLESITDKDKHKALSVLKSVYNKFQQEVIEMRNQLAHTKETIDSKGIALFATKDGATFEITEEGIKGARKKLKKHSDNLDSLHGHF